MTEAEKCAALETLDEAEAAASRAFNRVADNHAAEVDGRRCAIARTELEKAFAFARNVFHVVKTTEA